jgi:hypothetical protein
VNNDVLVFGKYVVESVVLAPANSSEYNTMAAINVFCDIVLEDSEKDSDQNDSIRPVISITREALPFVEWHKNAEIIASSFPDLFLLGKGLPTGIFLQSHSGITLCDTMMGSLIILGQLQRPACICKSA